MKKSLVLILSLIITLTLFAQKRDAITQIDQLAQKAFDENRFPGMAVAIWHKGETVFMKGYGFADIKNEVKIDPEQSKFRIGSVSKPVTAAALAQLYEEGKIDLDAPIQQHVPDFPKKKWDITLRQLAGHLAGIRHYKGLEFMSKKYYPTVNEGLEIFEDDDLLHEPNSKYAYSSYGWNLISAAIETAADTNFLDYMQMAVFEPLELEGMMPEHSNQEIENLVTFYTLFARGNRISPKVDNSYKWAGGGFIAPADDVMKFGVAHLKAGYLKAETLDIWTTPQATSGGKSTNYGIGWRSGEDKKGREWYGHSGGSVGGTSMLLIFPEQEMVVVTLVNQSRAKMNGLAFRLANQLLE